MHDLYIAVNPWHMHEGYGSRCVSVCLSVIKLAAIYFAFKSKMLCHKDPYGDPNAWYCVDFADSAFFTSFGIACWF